ncbi:hypothetical protein LOZ66_003516 [Ophidiomyces ophidiicola]|nr:hypothetical protein LOZ66_003516 [Ophidiomyces ophidiicola]
MALRGERFIVSLSDAEDDAPAPPHSSIPALHGFVADIKEREPSAPAAPAPPRLASTATGFPQPRKRNAPSAFRRQRATQNAAATATPPPANVPGSTPAADERRAIDEENKQRLASMGAPEIERERAGLMSTLSPSLIERLLKRATISDEEGSKERQATNINEESSQPADNPTNPPTEDIPQVSTEIHQANAPSNDDLPPPQVPQDIYPASRPPAPMHFPRPPLRDSPMPNLDPDSPSFLADLQTHYFPETPHNASSLSWLTPSAPDTPPTSAYHPNSIATSLAPAALRFSLTGALLAPRTALALPTTLGLHHHANDPEAAGYTISELAILSRSAMPAQRCLAWQVLGRLLYRLGRGEFGEKGNAMAEGLWSVVERENVVAAMLDEAAGGQGGVSVMPIRLPNRISFTPQTTVRSIWESLHLPPSALSSLSLPYDPDHDRFFPSSYKLDHLAQASIALATLAAALLYSARARLPQPPNVAISARGAALSFVSERLYTLSSQPPPSSWGVISGLYRTRDGGYVRVHDALINHRRAIAEILGVDMTPDGMVSRERVAQAIREAWDAEELERVALQGDAVVVKLRRMGQWEGWPAGDEPVHINRFAVPDAATVGDGGAGMAGHFGNYTDALDPGTQPRPLKGLRVLELSRVIAAPVAGRTLAALGADVLWVTAPDLPALPALDIDLGRGKRTIQLDFRRPDGKQTLLDLVRGADVLIQSYRPGSLAKYGLGPEDLAAANPGLVYASMSAYDELPQESNGSRPWAGYRGFDSLVQTCSGMNVSEAEHFLASSPGPGNESTADTTTTPARVLPCQALDHGAGYLLATGVLAAVYQRDFVIGGFGSYTVDVSLAGVAKYLQSLGQYPAGSGFAVADAIPKEYPLPSDGGGWSEDHWETRPSGFGELRGVKYPGSIEGGRIAWDVMPKRLGNDYPEWMA